MHRLHHVSLTITVRESLRRLCELSWENGHVQRVGLQGAAATFTNVTLLVPGSIRVGGLAGLYDAASIAKLGLDHQVTMLEKRMVALDSEARIVTLEDGASLPYEALVLCPGLQDQTRARLGIAPHDQV